MAELTIVQADSCDWDDIWPIFRDVVQSGDTYAYPPEITYDEARSIWMAAGVTTFVARDSHGSAIGSYIMKPNFIGLGSHVVNCGYMVNPKAQGLGIGKKMAEHSLAVAKEKGFYAMQYNFVVSTNERAVRLWKSLGFRIIGTAPKAFQHRQHGLVDTYMMFREL